jgi:hypothetical protein
MESALVGLAGLLIGALLAEYFRRNNRIEAYSQKIFERRLEIYEQLMKLVQTAYQVASDVVDDSELSEEDRKSVVGAEIMRIAEFVDENALFVDEYIAADATALFIGIEEIAAIQDQKDREIAVTRFRNHYKAVKQNLLEESGIRQINDHLKIVSRSKLDSPIIRLMKEKEKERA